MTPADPQIIRQPVTRAHLAELAGARFGDLLKAVVDVSRAIMAVSGELHSDEEALLLEDGSRTTAAATWMIRRCVPRSFGSCKRW